MPVEPIEDPSIKIKPTAKLIEFVVKCMKIDKAPANILALKKSAKSKRGQILLNLEDVKWLDDYLKEYRKTANEKMYIHEFLEGVDINLPTPKITPRDPMLEARIQKLTAQQNAREYEAMTKGVDSARKNLPEDTIAFQINSLLRTNIFEPSPEMDEQQELPRKMKEINRQLIAVAQFVFSIMAGFAFGFIGIELIVGNLDFGFRLLLGVICALVIALAEIYFLAKKLNEVHMDEFGSYSKLHQE